MWVSEGPLQRQLEGCLETDGTFKGGEPGLPQTVIQCHVYHSLKLEGTDLVRKWDARDKVGCIVTVRAGKRYPKCPLGFICPGSAQLGKAWKSWLLALTAPLGWLFMYRFSAPSSPFLPVCANGPGPLDARPWQLNADEALSGKDAGEAVQEKRSWLPASGGFDAWSRCLCSPRAHGFHSTCGQQLPPVLWEQSVSGPFYDHSLSELSGCNTLNHTQHPEAMSFPGAVLYELRVPAGSRLL